MAALLQNILNLSAGLQGLIIILTILGLWLGSEFIIKGGKSLARKLGVSEMVIGLTIVSIGSSFPEIFVNIAAGLKDSPEVGVGNIIGSCFVQISMILGTCVLIAGAMTEEKETIKRDGSMLLGSIIFLFILSLDGKISTLDSILMMTAYVIYIIYLMNIHENRHGHRKESSSHTLLAISQFLVGALCVWFSADILISIGINAGEKAGLGKEVIGLLSGIGTSVPELVVSLVALLKKSQGISVGNILGSNITDPLLSLPIGALLAHGYAVDSFFIFKAIPIWFLASLTVVSIFYFRGRLGRIWASILMAFYAAAFIIVFL